MCRGNCGVYKQKQPQFYLQQLKENADIFNPSPFYPSFTSIFEMTPVLCRMLEPFTLKSLHNDNRLLSRFVQKQSLIVQQITTAWRKYFGINVHSIICLSLSLETECPPAIARSCLYGYWVKSMPSSVCGWTVDVYLTIILMTINHLL